MNNNTYSFFGTRIPSIFSNTPIELLIFGFFSFIVSILYYSLRIFESAFVRESIFPILGLSPVYCYTMSSIFVYALIFSRDKIKKPMMIRLGIIGFLGLQILDGLFDLIMFRWNDFPIVKISIWYPLWAIVVPVLWIVILFSPRIKRFCELPKTDLLA